MIPVIIPGDAVTVTDLRKELQRLELEGKGDMLCIWNSMTHSYSVELLETTRNNKPVLVVNA